MQLLINNTQNFEDRMLKAMEKMENTLVSKLTNFDTSMTVIDEQLTVLQKPPPVSAIRKRGPGSGVANPLSSSASFNLSNIEANVGCGLRAQMKKQKYSKLKCLEQDNDMDIAIIEEAILFKSVGVPDGIHNLEFCSFFRYLVKHELTALCHNTQTLARKNWKGKEQQT